MKNSLVLLIMAMSYVNMVAAQENLSQNDTAINVSQRALNKIQSTTAGLDNELVKFTDRFLKRMEKQEKKIKRKLAKADSASSEKLFADADKEYSKMRNILFGKETVNVNRAGEYLAFVDSLKMNLQFLTNTGYSSTNAASIAKSLGSLNSVQDKLKYISVFQKYLKERRQLLRLELDKYGLGKYLKGLNKDVYYYSQKLNEYKSILNDPKKLELTAFRALQKIPKFKEFFEKNSYIASVFGIQNFTAYAGASSSAIPDFPGLQSRNQVDRYAANAFNGGAGGSGNSDPLQQGLGKLRNELDQLKNKSSSWDENAEMPDFKPNEMKSKSFLKRLEFGTNLQFGRPNALVPSTADIAGQIAYKFHQNGSFGIGASYKLGYGNLRRFSISHQGVGLRSFLDYKLKGQFYINGGFEYNYHHSFRTIEQLRDFSAWQSSALIGVSKKYKVSKKVKGSIIILYDFLYYQHSPRTQPLVFRLGYNF